MRIIFMGGKRRGFLCLQELLNSPDDSIIGVFCLKEHPHETIYYESLRDLAQDHGIPSWIPENINAPQMIQAIKDLAPDLILVIGWYQLISKRIRSIPPLGCIALHDSFLPKYRGSATTNWAIIRGETETGVTFFHLDAGVDTGDILAQRIVPIYPRDTAQTLLERKDTACVELVRETLPLIRKGCAPRILQNHEEATYMGKRSPDDGMIDWTWPSLEIDALIRSLTYPFPGAFTFLDDFKVYIWNAEPYNNTTPEFHGPPGQIIHRMKGCGVLVITGDGVLLVKKIQFEGDEIRPADEALKPTGSILGLQVLGVFQKMIILQETVKHLHSRLESLERLIGDRATNDLSESDV